jgi:hypothetical protein
MTKQRIVGGMLHPHGLCSRGDVVSQQPTHRFNSRGNHHDCWHIHSPYPSTSSSPSSPSTCEHNKVEWIKDCQGPELDVGDREGRRVRMV